MSKRRSRSAEDWSWKPSRPFQNARVLRAMYEHREAILEHYPRVPIPSSDTTPTPAAALILLWERWDALRGSCPTCGGLVLGFSFGGMLSIGSMSGLCVACAERVGRGGGSYGQYHTAVNLALAGTPFRLWTNRTFPGGWAMKGCASSLIAVLEEVGATGLREGTGCWF